ncbi:DUF1622 domain-containing protein [Roseibium salinum]|nr:DUF1622 domain-containing protein [Roseibium salinum]
MFLFRAAREGPSKGIYQQLRASLGRSILLGLEFLVAADIINTVAIDPTLESVAVLAAVVAVRTFFEHRVGGRDRGQVALEKKTANKPVRRPAPLFPGRTVLFSEAYASGSMASLRWQGGQIAPAHYQSDRFRQCGPVPRTIARRFAPCPGCLHRQIPSDLRF